MIKMIVAVDQGNAIGWKDGRLPWHIQQDLKRFKALTSGSTVVMGSATFKSLGRPLGLPNRKNMVLTHNPVGYDPSIVTVSDLDYVELNRGLEPMWIIGGASVYTQALERQMVDELHVTLVGASSGADVTLPFELHSWKLFVLRQRKQGIRWQIASIEYPELEPGSVPITYLTLVKQ